MVSSSDLIVGRHSSTTGSSVVGWLCVRVLGVGLYSQVHFWFVGSSLWFVDSSAVSGPHRRSGWLFCVASLLCVVGPLLLCWGC